MKNRGERQRGAIVIEATLSLTAFVFLMFTILSIVDICYVQSKIGVALDSAAKEISQYMYLYYKLEIPALEASFSEGTEDSKQVAVQTIDGLDIMSDSLQQGKMGIESGNYTELYNAAMTGTQTARGLANTYGQKLSEDPKGFILGMAKMAGNELKEEGKAILGQVLAIAFMEKNLKNYASQSADSFLRRCHVVNGIEGLDFDYTSLMAYGTSNQIQLVCTYEVEVIRFLNIDVKVKFRKVSRTNAWGNGISLISPENNPTTADTGVWDLHPLKRGKKIVEEEKKSFEFTAVNSGFDGYDPRNNEFITVRTIDTNAQSYQSADGVATQLNNDFRKMEEKVSELGEDIKMADRNGNETMVHSNPADRQYKILLVVPENASDEIVQEAVRNFRISHLGVDVQYKKAYGEPASSKKDTEDTTRGFKTWRWQCCGAASGSYVAAA